MSTNMPIAYASIVMQSRRTADFYDFTSKVFDQDLTVERSGIQYFFLVLQFSTVVCQFGSSFRQVIVDSDITFRQQRCMSTATCRQCQLQCQLQWQWTSHCQCQLSMAIPWHGHGHGYRLTVSTLTVTDSDTVTVTLSLTLCQCLHVNGNVVYDYMHD